MRNRENMTNTEKKIRDIVFVIVLNLVYAISAIIDNLKAIGVIGVMVIGVVIGIIIGIIASTISANISAIVGGIIVGAVIGAIGVTIIAIVVNK